MRFPDVHPFLQVFMRRVSIVFYLISSQWTVENQPFNVIDTLQTLIFFPPTSKRKRIASLVRPILIHIYFNELFQGQLIKILLSSISSIYRWMTETANVPLFVFCVVCWIDIVTFHISVIECVSKVVCFCSAYKQWVCVSSSLNHS